MFTSSGAVHAQASSEGSPPPVAHQRTNSAGLDNFFGGDVPAPQVSPPAAAPPTGDLFGSPAPAPPPAADDFNAFGDFASAPTPAPVADFADFGAVPAPAPTPAPALDDDFFGFAFLATLFIYDDVNFNRLLHRYLKLVLGRFLLYSATLAELLIDGALD